MTAVVGIAKGGITGTGSFSVTPPAGAAGYLAVLAVGTGSSTLASVTPPSGWTLQISSQNDNFSDFFIYTGTAAAGSSWTLGATASPWAASLVVVGYDTAVTVHKHNFSAANSLVSPSSTTTSACLVLRAETGNPFPDLPVVGYPTNAPANRDNRADPTANDPDDHTFVAVAHESAPQGAAGATGTATWTTTGLDSHTAHTIAILNVVSNNRTGTAASVMTPLTTAAAGTFASTTRTGAAASVVQPLGQAATGTHTAPNGVAQSVMQPLTQVSAGTFTPPARTGVGSSALPLLTQSAAGTVVNPPPVFRYVKSVHPSGRYFLDQDGAPILIKGDSPWSAFVDLSTAEWATWCANRESHGFNAASVSLLGNPENGGPNANGATFDGIQPFTGTFTPNPTYWARIDTFVQTAADHGITLFLYASDGWVVNTGLSGVISTMNATQAQAYGAFVATRYASSPNVLWMSGGDFFPGVGTDETISQNVLTGIRSVDTVRPHTMQAMYQRSASRQWSTWASKVQWDFIYTRLPGYELIRKSFARTPAMPTVFGEGIYDGMYSGTTAQSELVSRMQIGWALTSGAAGDFYGTEDWQFGSGWAGRLDRNSAVQADRMRAAVQSVAWWKLEPAPSFITSGAGTPYVFPNEPSAGSDPGFPNLVDSGAPSGAAGTLHTHTYGTAAVSQDGSVAVVYLPTQRAITIDTSDLGAGPTGSWVNPTTGASTTANLGSLTPPSSGDWLLVLQATPIVGAVTGSGASVLPGLAQTGAGTRTVPVFTGTAASVLPGLTQVANGTHVLPGRTGVGVSVLQGLTMAAVGEFDVPVFSGAATSTLPTLAQIAVGDATNPPGFVGAAASALGPLTQSATGVRTIPPRTGAAVSVMPVMVQYATGTGGSGGAPDLDYPLRLVLTAPRRTVTLNAPKRTLEWSHDDV